MQIKKKNIIVLLVLLIPLLMVVSANENVPDKPINLVAHPDNDNFWINFTWDKEANTDSFNVSVDNTVNRNWTNGTNDTFINAKSFPHGWVYIQIAGYNVTSQQLSDFVYIGQQIPDNPIFITNVSDTYFLLEGQTIYIDADYEDHDGDTGVFATTATKGELNSSTGVFIWTSAVGDRGYTWQINVTDIYGPDSKRGYVSTHEFTVNVNPYVPGTPTLANTIPDRKNFSVNYSWKAGENTDSFNVSINGTWFNGTKDTFINTKSEPHKWVNISIAGYNATSNILSNFAFKYTQITNNPISITNVTDTYYLMEGQTLDIDANYEDHDNDTGFFETTATKGTFDNSTGNLSWTPSQGEGGIYNWSIKVADGFGPYSSKNFKVIVRMNYGIRFIEPGLINEDGTWVETWHEATVGHIGKFIGIDGIFDNTGEEILTFTITDYPVKYCPIPCIKTLSPGQRMTFMDALWGGRLDFEINFSDVNPKGFLNYTLNISVIGYNGPNPTFSNFTSTTISLPINQIFRMKYASGGIVAVLEGATTTVNYTLEANSGVNLTNVSIYDPFYQNGPYFNISKLQVNETRKTCWDNETIVDCKKTFTYKVTTDNLKKFKCLGGYPCIINMATFKGINELGESINDTDFVKIFTEKLTPVENTRSNSRDGGGGGGGGIPPSEDFNNIERREVREMDVLYKMASAYTFKSADPVVAVSFESSVSENGVPVAVEVLKNRSKKIGIDAPGELYYYFNVFVGTSGFSRKVSNGVIVYRVNNSWLKQKNVDPKNIRLFKWDGNWTEKATEIVDDKSNFTYYASFVGNFSSFAIAGKEDSNPVVTITDPIVMVTRSLNDTTISNVKQPQALYLIIGGVLIIGILGLMYHFRIKYRK